MSCKAEKAINNFSICECDMLMGLFAYYFQLLTYKLLLLQVKPYNNLQLQSRQLTYGKCIVMSHLQKNWSS